AAYRSAASDRRAGPLAAVPGHAAAARVLQKQGNLTSALAEYRQALTAWDLDYGPWFGLYGLDVRVLQSRDIVFGMDLAMTVTRQDVVRRVERLRDAAGRPDGALLERGRWLLEQREWADAARTSEQLLTRYPRSRLVRDARYALHVAQLRIAIAGGTATS